MNFEVRRDSEGLPVVTFHCGQCGTLHEIPTDDLRRAAAQVRFVDTVRNLPDLPHGALAGSCLPEVNAPPGEDDDGDPA